MARKPKKAYRPPVSPTAAPSSEAAAKAPSPMPEPRSKRVREVKISAKERALAAKKAARARLFERTA